jgi:hypothetical protein
MTRLVGRMLDHYGRGNVLASSVEVSPIGTARLSAVYADGIGPIELPGVVPEED